MFTVLLCQKLEVVRFIEYNIFYTKWPLQKIALKVDSHFFSEKIHVAKFGIFFLFSRKKSFTFYCKTCTAQGELIDTNNYFKTNFHKLSKNVHHSKLKSVFIAKSLCYFVLKEKKFLIKL